MTYFNKVFEFLEKNKLPSPNQYGFWPIGSYENQLLSIVHSIYADFDQSPLLEAKANLLAISKVFDKAWHEGLLYKLETDRSLVNSGKFFQSFLHDRFQSVVINGQSSNWSPILERVPQGSVLEILFFLV